MKKLFLTLVLVFGLVIPAFGGYEICDTYLRPIPALVPGYGYLSGGAYSWVFLYNSTDTSTKVDSAYTDENGKYCMTVTYSGLYKVKAGTTWYKDYYMPEVDSGYVSGYPNAQRQYHYVINKSGGTLGVSSAVVFDSLGIVIGAFTADGTKRDADFLCSLSVEGGWNSVVIAQKGTAVTDTVWIWGTTNSSAVSEVITLAPTTANAYKNSKYLWSDVDSIKYNEVAGGIDSCHLTVYSFSGVKASTIALAKFFAGIVYPSSIADNSIGTIVTEGAVPARTKLSAITAPLLPGMRLTVGAGVCSTATGASDSGSLVIGEALEATASLNDTLKVYLFGR